MLSCGVPEQKCCGYSIQRSAAGQLAMSDSRTSKETKVCILLLVMQSSTAARHRMDDVITLTDSEDDTDSVVVIT